MEFYYVQESEVWLNFDEDGIHLDNAKDIYIKEQGHIGYAWGSGKPMYFYDFHVISMYVPVSNLSEIDYFLDHLGSDVMVRIKRGSTEDVFRNATLEEVTTHSGQGLTLKIRIPLSKDERELTEQEKEKFNKSDENYDLGEYDYWEDFGHTCNCSSQYNYCPHCGRNLK